MSKEFEHLAKVICRDISRGWKERNTPRGKPLVLLFGGLQGSGKTTVVDLIKDKLDLVVISPDEIRQQLFNMKFPFGERFVQAVDSCRDELIEKAFGMGMPFVVDTNAKVGRMEHFEALIPDPKKFNLLKVLLEAPYDVLRRRVQTRKPRPGVYSGTLDELEAEIVEYSEYANEKAYDLVIDTIKYKPQEISRMIIELANNY